MDKKIRNWFRRKKVKPKNPPRRLIAVPNASPVHSSVLNLQYRTNQDPDNFWQPLSPQLPRSLSILSVSSSDYESEYVYEQLQRRPIRNATTSQNSDSSAHQTQPKTVASAHSFDLHSDGSSPSPHPTLRPRHRGPDRGQLPDRPNDSGFRMADSIDCSLSSPPPVPRPRLHDQLHDSGARIAASASCAPDIPTIRCNEDVREHPDHSEGEPEGNNQPLHGFRSIPESVPVRRTLRDLPPTPVHQGSVDRNQEASPFHTLKSDPPESPAGADALPEAYRVAEFIDGHIGRLPVQPSLISVNNAAGPVTIHHNGPVTIHHTVIISPEGESLANIIAREQYKVSSSIINRPTAAQSQQYFRENYVRGAPKARQEAMNRERSRNEAS